MPRTQMNCPQCRQPITAEIQQVFDVGANPGVKNLLLSGQANVAQCPQCGFNGALTTPLVYHDPSKELLLTFVPPELALPRDEQERVIGGMIKQVVDALPAEQRKGYLFSPQSALTYQGLIERILEEDGISKEVIEGQQRRVNLIQRLAAITDEEALAIVVKEEDKHIDQEFFGMLSQLAQMAAAQGDQQGANQLATLQKRLLPITTAGKELQERSAEVEKVMAELRAAGNQLTREKLLEMVTSAETDLQVEAYASMARPGMDYQFFQQLSDKIEAAEGEEKERLSALRDTLLEITSQIDQQLQERVNMSRQNVEILLKVEENLPEVILQNIQAIDDYFLQALVLEIEEANQKGDEERVKKLQKIMEVIQEVLQNASLGPEGVLLEALLEVESPEERKAIMEENADKITPEFIESVTSFMMQLENAKDEQSKQMSELVRTVYREALRFSMKSQMGK
ncbi:MAG TPA: CpXC domain-containing protein [Anaerolineales bacterium]|nr:CpXC domain-containing protein [Anaerolineales bacterium]